MSKSSAYSQCCRMLNQPVEIRCYDGSIHRGILTHVDRTNAYLQMPDANFTSNPGLFLWGGYGWGFPVALASIAAILALGFLW
ncbi:hypothetical protein [Sporolactobacillus inulinus]|jgi:hypothetical protein|uniref:LSM domain-containing protein n=2 Tax=Sporolactobacillus inulinus TaxID=2078 RepID=A0A4Y3SZY7_9BACL|nr:hypothetical protein [Sporolactobacillus inulinus]KLI02684.1 hypothetical protein SINU_06605 [Sporolactobacillus inulinus CASD]GAY75765.1 hypothetical protein NBRC111894_1319 [Sporolactobacillus inulinus]GEB76031.1 hypothetical protein SIN01_03760 [Sporolactobacillus inulinus]